jgi:hypothetical protein
MIGWLVSWLLWVLARARRRNRYVRQTMQEVGQSLAKAQAYFEQAAAEDDPSPVALDHSAVTTKPRCWVN